MDEKIYQQMSRSGAMSLAFGIIAIVMGTAAGVMLIISGSKLLAGRKKILF